jgi:hypothetical protein
LDRIEGGIKELRAGIKVATLWLTIIAFAIACVFALAQSAEGTEGEDWEVQMSSVSCFADERFLDGWETRTYGTIQIDMEKAQLNLHDIEVWSEGLRTISVPAATKKIDVTGIVKPSFKIVNRQTLERRTLVKSAYMSVASCQINPPPDDASWVWDEEAGRFELKIIKLARSGQDDKFSMHWSYEMVEVPND